MRGWPKVIAIMDIMEIMEIIAIIEIIEIIYIIEIEREMVEMVEVVEMVRMVQMTWVIILISCAFRSPLRLCIKLVHFLMLFLRKGGGLSEMMMMTMKITICFRRPIFRL